MTKQELKDIIEEAYYEVLASGLLFEAEGDEEETEEVPEETVAVNSAGASDDEVRDIDRVNERRVPAPKQVNVCATFVRRVSMVISVYVLHVYIHTCTVVYTYVYICIVRGGHCNAVPSMPFAHGATVGQSPSWLSTVSVFACTRVPASSISVTLDTVISSGRVR